MDELFEAVSDYDTNKVTELIDSGLLTHINRRDAREFKNIMINLVASIRWAPARTKIPTIDIFTKIMRHAPEMPMVYNIATVSAAHEQMDDIALALMLKGGAPSAESTRPLTEDEAKSDLLKLIVRLEREAHQQSKSFKDYAEEQGHHFSLEEVLERIERQIDQVGGRRRKGRKTRKGRKAKKQTRRR